MIIRCICLLAGAYSLELLPRIPADPALAGCLALTVLFAAVRPLRPAAFYLAGFCLMSVAASKVLEEKLDQRLQGQVITIEGRIADFPQRIGAAVRFEFAPLVRDGVPSRIRLAWYDAAVTPGLGEHWRLQVRLRRPRGYANPDGFDYAGWLFRQRIGATGYVFGEHHNYQVLGTPMPVADRLRRHIVERIRATLPAEDATAVLMAIAVGARQDIDREQWDRYAATGTTHLMAISGLHVGLAAGSALLVCWGASSLLTRRRNVRDIALCGGVLAAGAYALLSGFAVPAQRALLMSVIAGGMLLMRRRIHPFRLLALTAILVFAIDPLAVLAPGFKLSFAAVAVLFLASRPLVVARSGLSVPLADTMLRTGVRIIVLQVALLGGLFALSVLEFDRVSLAAPFVNLAVLPIFNFLTVPLTLAGVILDGVFQPLGNALLGFAHRSITWVLRVVEFFSKFEFLSFRTSSPARLWPLILPAALVLLPPGWPGRRVAAIAVLAVIDSRPAPPEADCFEMHVLDVGQGLAVVVQTHAHALLFDTGPAFRSGGDTAQMVVLPFLRSRGVVELQKVILSHADLDHAGGIGSVVEALPVAQVLVGELLAASPVAQQPCVAGDRWTWDGVAFVVLHPRRDSPWRGNDASCVLEISAGDHRVLLTGDIEAPVEQLLRHHGVFNHTHAVVVPHHGSRTSSTAALVDATRPRLAIVSAGHDNRWGFPKQDVTERWQRSGAILLNTATDGAISQRICRHSGAGTLDLARPRRKKYWHDAPPDTS